MSSRERAQSGVLGVALILGLTIIGTTTVVVFGAAALTDTQEQSAIARAEQSMTLFDSQAAQVALGESEVQTVNMGRGEGTYSVNPTAGQISLVQLDCDDNDGLGGGGLGGYDPATGTLSSDDYRYFSKDLGSMTYETGDTTLAYQGGGVWRRNARGGVGMVSPPEFHYRGATLTFPVVLTRGSGGASADASATVTRTSVTRQFSLPGQAYPSSSPDCQNSASTEYLTNPVTDGTVVVRVKSEYASAWGRYFSQRTGGLVSYYDPDSDGRDEVVLVKLVSLGQLGDFQMPGEGSSVTVSGASGAHETQEFTIRLRPDDTDAANFNNLQWTMYADEGSTQFEIHLKKSGSGDGCNSGTIGSTSITADVAVYYSTDNGNNYQGWDKPAAYEAECADLNGDGDDEIYMDVELVDDEDGDGDYTEVETNDPAFTYQSLTASDLEHYNPNGNFDSTTTFSGHGDWESQTYDSSVPDTETMDRLINHYFAELPESFALTVDDKGSDTVSEAGSSGYMQTGGSGRYVTYLHVTTNEVKVVVED